MIFSKDISPLLRASAFALLALAGPPLGRAAVLGFEPQEGLAAEADISTHADWKKSTPATGTISREQAKSGEQSLKIAPSKEDQAVVRGISVPKDGIVFLDFWVLPTVDAAVEPRSTFDGGGAILGFVKSGEKGTVVAVSDPATGASVPVDYQFEIDEKNVAADWVRVTIRENTTVRTWDLYLDGKLELVDQPLSSDSKVKAQGARLSFYANAAGVTFLDDLSIAEENPLFPDADKDGVPDAVEMVNGTNAYFDDRALDPNGNKHSNIDDFRLGNPLTTPAGPNEAAARRMVYIDNRAGADSETGEMSYRVEQNGPKRSLRGAAAIKGRDVVFVLMPSDQPYVCPDYPTGTAPNVSYVLLGNATLTGE